MEVWTWIEIGTWWIVVLDATVYNVLAWGGRDWYEKNFGRLARIFPVTKAFGLLYGGPRCMARLGFGQGRRTPFRFMKFALMT